MPHHASGPYAAFVGLLRKAIELDGAGWGGAVRHECWFGSGKQPRRFEARPDLLNVTLHEGHIVAAYRVFFSCDYCGFIFSSGLRLHLEEKREAVLRAQWRNEAPSSWPWVTPPRMTDKGKVDDLPMRVVGRWDAQTRKVLDRPAWNSG